MRDTNQLRSTTVGLADVLIMEELARRPARPPDFEAEVQALLALTDELAANPATVLPKLVETALELCRAGSAGISLLEPDGTADLFRWHAVAGRLAANRGSTMPRAACPSGVVVERNSILLFAYPARLFRDSLTVEPPIVEALMVPLPAAGKPVGTLWVFAHSPKRKFDAEDVRLLQGLARFAAAAHQLNSAWQGAAAARGRLEELLRAWALELRGTEARLGAELAAMRRLHDLVGRLVVCPDLRTALDEILAATVEITGAEMGDVQLFDGSANALDVVAQRGFAPEFLDRFRRIGIDTCSACGRAAQLRERVIIEDVETDHEFESFREAARQGGFRSVQSTPLLGRDGELLGMFSTHYRQPHHPSARDLRILDLYTRQAAEVIERTRAEERLRVSEQRFRLVVHGARGFAMFTMDPQGRITTWNPAAEALLGWSKAEAVGQLGAIIFTPEDRAAGKPEEEMATAARHGQAADERWHVGKDGSRFWGSGELTAAPLGPGGEPGGFVKVMRNETARKQAEDRLRESEERLRVALAAAEMGTWLWRIPQDEQVLDESLRRLMGLAPGERFRTLHQFLQHIYEPDRARVRDALERCLHESGELDMEFRVPWPDGSLHWLKDRGKFFLGPDGQPLFLAGACMDITDRKRMEDELREAGRRKDEFLAMLGHELRNPLTPLRNLAEILRFHQLDAAGLERAYAMMERQVNHLTRLVDDLLDVSRITRGLVELHREPVHLARIANEAVEMAAPVIEGQRHELMLALPRRPLWVNGDPTRLTQILFNLLNNAAKYTEPGGKIWLTVEREDGLAVMRVRDNGTGIAAELLPRVFDLFTQGDRTLDRSQGGLGLGLTLVKRLVEMHGGRVEAHSEGRGKGSEFVVRLPAMPAEVEEAARPPRPLPVPESGQVDRALVVDDNYDVADSLALQLRGLARDVRVAHSGQEALQVAREYRPDVILCDIGMPGMNGYEVARRLRREPGLEHVLLAAVSGYGQEEYRRLSQEAGFDRHLVKPVARAVLEELLKETAAQPAPPAR